VQLLLLSLAALAAPVQDGDLDLDDLVLDDLMDDGLDELLSGDWAGDEVASDGEGSPLTGLKGFLELRGRSYLAERGSGANDEQLILEGELELDFDLGARTTGYLRPRVLVDLVDEEADRFEPYEAYVTVSGSRWDLRAGQFVENWGIVDTFNPIDVVNRRDFGSDFLDADRLGELGVRYRRFYDGNDTFGEPTLSFYALPVFQETPFPTSDSRFSFSALALPFDEDAGGRPSGGERAFYAARLQSTFQSGPLNADLQLLAARGPERFPVALPVGAELAPFYYGTTTIGGGIRAVPNADALGDFLSTLTLKAEVAAKRPYDFDSFAAPTPDDYVQYVLGLDRLFPNLVTSGDQLTLMAEYAAEDGADDAASLQRPFQSDVVLRAFYEKNDFSRTSLDARAIVDTELDERVYEVIFERQLRAVHEDLQWFAHLQVFDADETGLFSALPDNTSLTIGLRFEF
jgi:hypothetical protein